jgi:NTP pyrophosphatase (non-canonical NTP hydrolase)
MKESFTFDQYHNEVHHLAQYPMIGENLIYPALGISGEAGEVADKVKKLWRNKDKTCNSELTPEERNDLVKELGDVLWYLNALAAELNTSLSAVAQVNSEKLNDRARRGVIKSEGDNR